MRDLGITPTTGQTLGGQFKSMEEFAQNLPLIGSSIENARQRVLFDFNKSVVNNALKKVNDKLPSDVVGRDAIAYASEQVSNQYDDVLSKMTFDLDFATTSNILSSLSKNTNLSANQRQEVASTLNDIVLGKFAGQKIDGKEFKGIESDILPDGNLDYPTEVLKSFDFIVSSVHSVLNMDLKRATDRLLTAIQNPYTTILGHPTGRLLLRREGYPIDHKSIIDACAEKQVVIEINANPWRLDLDWRWVRYAMEQGVMLSINPDAHEMEGYADMQYGVWIGRKGGLTKELTLNALSGVAIASYFEKRKANR
jgi:histidinol phosphatase-like PHP family hydrolase